MQQIKWIFILFILWIGRQAIAQIPQHQVQNPMNPFDELPSNRVQAIYSYIENGGHINKRGYYDESFLHIAAYLGDIALASFLLEHRPRVDLVDEAGWTPLHVAAYMKHQDFANFLLQHGADINKKDFLGQTSLHIATYREHADFVAFLIQQNASDEIDELGQGPLFLAASKGNIKIALMLLNAGASLHQREKIHNWTPLYAAIHGKNKEIVSLFLEHGADPNVVDIYDRTPLVFALYKMRREIAIFLARQESVNIHIPDEDNVRPIHLAAFIGDTDLISTLLHRKALVPPSYSQANQGMFLDAMPSQIVYLALYGYNPIESLTLISNIMTTQNRLFAIDGQTWPPWIDWILYGGHINLIKVSIMHERLEKLIDQVSAVHQETGQTYLHSALHRRSNPFFIERGLKDPKEQIKFLMESGFEINNVDNEGRVPFHWSLYEADPELVEFFRKEYYDPMIEEFVSQEKSIIKDSCEDVVL